MPGEWDGHTELSFADQPRIRGLLDALAAELSAELEQTKSESAPVDLDTPIGRLSRMDAIQHQKMAEATRRQIERRLSQVRVAKQRLEHGAYGVCRVCEEDIDLRRLGVRPEVGICTPCQQRAESSNSAG